MRSIIDHETYGQIVYEESPWTGKKTLLINGKYLTKTGKKTFSYSNGDEKQQFAIGGDFLRGAHITDGKEKIQLTRPIKWYELLLPIITFIALLVWASVPSLVLIFPLVGGAIGGLIGGICMVVSMLVMKSIKNVSLKILAWLGISVLTVLVNFLVATFIIAALA